MNDEESQQLKEALALSLVDTGRVSTASIGPPSRQPPLAGREDGGIPPQAHSSPTNGAAPRADNPATAQEHQPAQYPPESVARDLGKVGTAGAIPIVGPSGTSVLEDGVGSRSGEGADVLSELRPLGAGEGVGQSKCDKGGVEGAETPALGLTEGEEELNSSAAAATDYRPHPTEEQPGASSSGSQCGASAASNTVIC